MPKATSKAYVFTRHGGPEVETFADRPTPSPGPGQLLVAVRAAGVNPVDWKLRGGYRRPGSPPASLPEALGSEAAGVVEEIGAGVEGFAVGDAVFGSTLTGGYAEYTLLPVAITAHKPDALSFADAAVLPVAAATAYDAVRQADLPPGATLLITGAGGGVGVAAVQLARGSGLRVIGTASAGKKEFVESLGAVHVPPGPDLAARVRAVAPDGVDAVLDLVGGDTLRAAAELLVDRTKLFSVADKATVPQLGGAVVVRQRTAAVLDEVAKLVVSGALRPFVTRTFPLERADEALRAVEAGHVQGKIVIEVGA
ncbi:NADP-dependent oxidoreductase [Streptomyces scopuliridis]|uniref:NADP-dependent oxidoreductase n=1 Tax=Streptomyces scopuliridis TaxID=452529 RepID=A0ACD4ZUG3_9ACTN|nr:NADP-dependent oxidoreductase [Streptomyces scopuliridis]WSC02153.1 NADP-dependent oxidoreductase [Streptomyces scopuliridis]WSC04310.1 NADP-dependent oxidoreductase [Streptomyces scopuliridis]